MALSARTLFHYTEEQGFLIDALQNGFAPRYCLEDFSYAYPPNPPGSVEIALAMKCFCDIRLSQTQEHTAMYGEYVIGLTKEWAIRNEITPVLYFHETSLNPNLYIHVQTTLSEIVMGMLGKSMEEMASTDLRSLPYIPSALSNCIGIMHKMKYYMKQIDGYMLRGGERMHKYFYDEKEWRYTPQTNRESPEENARPELFIEEFRDEVIKEQEHRRLRQYHRLLFDETDIKYLIVPSAEKEIEFKQALRDQVTRFGNIDNLIQKVRNFEDIRNDH
ncbi:abortive infection system antitoxin AbiGi family protein [Rufibacter sediminis]|uniref:abortive infection system antitoxin AbiGi family protein n=1 Tax=Rufibacter sediminis TaxID=2762756 RepID=UPI00210C656C|nr:abortive infection system antitoxin AbiGi family protein [Rufibacter sediminis]